MPQAAHAELTVLRIRHKCDEICQSNVFISSNIPVLQSYKNKCHTSNVIRMIGKLQNQQFNLLYTDTPVYQQDLILLVNKCVRHVTLLLQAPGKKLSQCQQRYNIKEIVCKYNKYKKLANAV